MVLRRLVQLSGVVFVSYAALVAAAMLLPSFQSVFVYLHVLRIPFYVEYDSPQLYGLHGTRNLDIVTMDGLTLGAWHVLPAGHETLAVERAIAHGTPMQQAYDNALRTSNSKVFLYFHGNAGTRAVGHRVELYKVIAGHLGGHVITFDYRGFGNSDGWPSEEGLNVDAYSVYRWVLSKVDNDASRIVIWGHSLGSGVSARLVSELCIAAETGARSAVMEKLGVDGVDAGLLPLPSALILDAPFSSLQNAALYHPAGRLFQVVPYYQQLLTIFLQDKFPSVERIRNITIPLLILHGRQDFRLPFMLGEALYESATAARAARAGAGGTIAPAVGKGYKVVIREAHGVRFVELPLGEHNSIYSQPGLVSSVYGFFADHVDVAEEAKQ